MDGRNRQKAMRPSTTTSERTIRGIAALFDEGERKQLFRKYLLFLGWVEVAILVVTILYQLGNQGYDQSGPIPIPFPWKMYFIISFLAPVAITFLIGVVIVGFNKYFSEPEALEEAAAREHDFPGASDPSSRLHKIQTVVHQLQRLPFLSLLLLLAIAVGIFYRLDSILSFIGTVGETSVKIVLLSAAVLLGVAVILALVLIGLNYRLRRKSMEYEYKTEMGQRFGLLILEDNTVLNREGKLLIQGKKWKDVVPLLPAAPQDNSAAPGRVEALPQPPDVDT
jgi:hypothetical protein